MRAVVAGAGFLGAKISADLVAAGYTVTIVRRSATQGTVIACDLTVEKPAFADPDFDLAVFCLAPGARDPELYEKTYCSAQKNFLSAVSARQYIYISSTAVYADAAAEYSELSATAHSERARILLEAENIALTHQHACVLRLSGIYSRERPIYSSSRMAPGGAQAPVADRLVHFIHRDDAAKAVLHSVSHKLSGIYNVHDGHPQRRSTILLKLGLFSGESSPASERIISAEKLFSTGFNPTYPDYFAGTCSE